MPSNVYRQNIFFCLIGLCAIAIYGAIIYQNAYNIPKWDDFPEILRFLDLWLVAGNSADKFSAFISQTNEHILLVNHLIILCQYYLIGHLDFAWLIYIGNIFYIGSALALWFFFTDPSNRAFCFAITMLAGVTFYPYDSTLWAMTAISNQAVIFFSLLAIYAAGKQKINLPVIMLLSTLAVFSQSNGLIVLPVIGAFFFATKKWHNLKIWFAFTLVVIGLYACWFNPATRPDQSLLSILNQLPPRNYLLTVPTFFAYIGGGIFSKLTITSLIIAVVIGTGIIGITYVHLKQNLFSPSVLMLIGFLLISILSIAAYRGLFIGPDVAFVSRYKMYGSYFLIIGVLLSPLVMTKVQKSQTWKFGTLSIAIFYFSSSFYTNIAQAKIIDGDLFRSLQHWVEDGDFRRGKGYFIRDADSYLFSALRNKTYNPMVLIPENNVVRHVEKLASCPHQDKQIAAITTDFIISHKNPNAAGIKLISRFDNSTPLLVTLCSAEFSYQFEITSGKNNNDSAVYFIDRDVIAPGNYAVWLRYDETHYRLENTFVNKSATR